jgi:cell wall-associated NlpC family hydrolase
METRNTARTLRILAALALASGVVVLCAGCAPHRRGPEGPWQRDNTVQATESLKSVLPEPRVAPALAAATPQMPSSSSPAAASDTAHLPARAARVRELALSFRGVPYKWGGTTPRGFDCSGLVQYVYRDVGVNLPRTSGNQALKGSAVSLTSIEVGDLIFFSIKRGVISHVAIYVGDNQFLHAPSRGKRVCTESLDNPWWRSRIKRVRRVLG